MDKFAIGLFASPQILANSIFPMVSTGMTNSCSPLTLNFLRFFLCFLLTTARISRGWWCEVILKTHFWLYQFLYSAHSSAILAAGGKARCNTRVEQASDSRNILWCSVTDHTDFKIYFNYFPIKTEGEKVHPCHYRLVPHSKTGKRRDFVVKKLN